MLDIPYSDHFTVKMRWDVVEASPGRCKLTLVLSIPFSLKIVFRSTIQKVTWEEAGGRHACWVERAKQLLLDISCADDKKASPKSSPRPCTEFPHREQQKSTMQIAGCCRFAPTQAANCRNETITYGRPSPDLAGSALRQAPTMACSLENLLASRSLQIAAAYATALLLAAFAVGLFLLSGGSMDFVNARVAELHEKYTQTPF